MRVLIVSDIHANLIALETVLSAAEGQYDAVWCLGDLVGYGPRPNECVELLRGLADVCVMGNHDWAVLGRPGINVDDFNPQARQAVLWTRAQLSAENRAFLDQLPDQPIHPPEALDILITHASPNEPVWEYILTPTTAMYNFQVFDEELCFVGHTHKPAIFRWLGPVDGDDRATVEYRQPAPGVPVRLETSSRQRLIVNPGSVGQPRDNDARAAYALLNLESRIWRQERIAYPIELTQNQMRDAGLPKRLVDRLSFGW